MIKVVIGRDFIINLIYKLILNVKIFFWSIYVFKVILISLKIELMVLIVCKIYIGGNLLSIKVLYKGFC